MIPAQSIIEDVEERLALLESLQAQGRREYRFQTMYGREVEINVEETLPKVRATLQRLRGINNNPEPSEAS